MSKSQIQLKLESVDSKLKSDHPQKKLLLAKKASLTALLMFMSESMPNILSV